MGRAQEGQGAARPARPRADAAREAGPSGCGFLLPFNSHFPCSSTLPPAFPATPSTPRVPLPPAIFSPHPNPAQPARLRCHLQEAFKGPFGNSPALPESPLALFLRHHQCLPCLEATRVPVSHTCMAVSLVRAGAVRLALFLPHSCTQVCGHLIGLK